MPDNPLLDPSFRIRWSLISPDLVGPGIDLALTAAEEALAGIEAREGAATFDNTLLALEKATEGLRVAWAKVSHLQSVADTPALREAYNRALPKVSAFYARIPMRPALWKRLRAYEQSPEAKALVGIRRRFLNETLADFREAGADLEPASRQRLEDIQTELSTLTQLYSEHVLDATNAWEKVVTDEALLAGLPAHAKAAARASAAAKGLGGDGQAVWRFTLHQPSQEPVMTYLEDAGLRSEMWTAAVSVGARPPHDNAPLIARIVALRSEKACLLGRDHFADVILARRMAGSGARALAFIDDLRARCRPAFLRECRELEDFKRAEAAGGAGTGAGPGARLAPWDIAFWSERLRKARHDFDEEQLRPYFPLDRVVAGMFTLVERLFGIHVIERKPADGEVWHADVRVYDVSDGAGRWLGSFYADWHPRDSKRGGAWMGELITGGPCPDGSRLPHLGYICGNLTPPSVSGSALLTHREVETVFHEFGHLLHHLLSEVEIRSLSGTIVAWDFVELPSQIMENWCWERESLDLFARHHLTGEPLPDSLFDKMVGARRFRSGCATMRQVALARLDLLLHTAAIPVGPDRDVEPLARTAIEDCLIPTEPRAPTILKRFTHLFSDPVAYAAGYYSYKWAEVLEADAFTRFQKEGIFSAKVGREFVDRILSRGNSDDAAQLFRDFMGRDPDPTALLVRSGLA